MHDTLEPFRLEQPGDNLVTHDTIYGLEYGLKSRMRGRSSWTLRGAYGRLNLR